MISSLNSLVTLNDIAQTCFSGRAKGKFLFFKAHHPSTEILVALVGFKPRTEPELGDSYSTSTPPLPVIESTEMSLQQVASLPESPARLFMSHHVFRGRGKYDNQRVRSAFMNVASIKHQSTVCLSNHCRNILCECFLLSIEMQPSVLLCAWCVSLNNSLRYNYISCIHA